MPKQTHTTPELGAAAGPVDGTQELLNQLRAILDAAPGLPEFSAALRALLLDAAARPGLFVSELAEHLARAADTQAMAGTLHDVRSSLQWVLLSLEDAETALASGSSSTGDATEVRRSIEDARRAATLANHIAETSSALNNPRNWGSLSCDLADALMYSARHTRRRIAGTGTLECESLPPTVVRAPRGAVLRVVDNLLRNSCRAIDGQDDARIEIHAWTSDDEAFVEVADNGPGVPDPIRDEIFRPYYTTRNDGYGVGLFVCRTLVAGWGGTLRLISGPGEGARFVFSVPLVEVV